MPLINFFLMILLSLTLSLPAFSRVAADESSVPADVQDLTSAQQPTQQAWEPEGLIEYIEQEVETLKEEGPELLSNLNEALEISEERAAAKQADKLQVETGLTGDYDANYYVLDELNTGLPTLSPPPNLLTPMATLEFFQTAATMGRYDLAAYALNMNLFDPSIQSSRGTELAKRLDFLLNRRKLYNFNKMPDRPDGLIEPSLGGGTSIQGISRRSIRLGNIDYRGHRIPIFVERVRVDESAPVWVFSAQTVSHIDKLYEQYKPAKFESYLPALLILRVFGIAVWEYFALLVFFIITLGLGWVVSKLTGLVINRYSSDKKDGSYIGHKKSITDLINKFTVPLTFTISFSLVFTLVSGGFPFIEAIATATRPIIWIILVLSTIWLGVRIINFFANRYEDIQIDSLGDEDYDEYRKRITYLSVFRRVFIFVMVIGSVWIGLSEFVNLEGFGKTLLTSAGILSVVIGIAAQPTLGNIVAGLQIAMTQPIRIGDTIMYDGNWSTVEDLGYTYATIKTWDERRLFVPMRYFVTETVENWSHPDPHQTFTVSMLVDYGIKVDDVRKKYVEVVQGSEYWDGKTEPMLQVLSVDRDTIELYGTLAADNPDDGWMLQCEVREHLLAYLYDEQKPYLPAERITFKEI
ncbi:mechanosensitive ion channel family protein [uncultured Psychrobacter sp.]|uniref:mechanosensitive ion channel family protein n=1 Tax=uncultured Psychrobacter sp. TaxID=259303 RepID=UPI003458A8C7